MAELLRVTRVDGAEDLYHHEQLREGDARWRYYGYRVEVTGALTVFKVFAERGDDGVIGALVATYSPGGWIKASGFGTEVLLRPS